MFKLYLDPGHGGSDSGATGNGLQEKNIVLDIALRIRDILNNEYNNIEVNMSRTTDTYVSLDQRTNEANSWNADYFLSVHCNAFNGSAQGYEDYIYSGLSDSSPTAQYRDIMHDEIIAVNELTNRGKKKANFHVLRESFMSALLTENGFIDHSGDSAKLADATYRQQVARGHVNGLERAFNLEKSASDTLYKVIAGSFQDRENAEERVAYLDSNGIPSFLHETTITGDTWYRVQAGAYSSRSNAEERLTAVKELGIEDAYILEDQGESEVTGYAIAGSVVLSPQQMDQFVRTVNPDAPALGTYYLTFGQYYGLRGDVTFAQALHETDYFRFTGVVDEEQNNFAGIGATGPDNPGASFDTPEDGVLAHIQHLYAYASTESLPDQYPLVDPRFDLVERGSAVIWVDLNGKWAVPGDQYAQMILGLYENIVNTSIDQLQNILEQISI
ncbi:N-acetylmuramoyl-L-alanine amidase [Virgibacillus natechei]|uniref:N-acetylmuramoyl-L-alanine amidase n=1 Tax=Virgibacillus natechei TaxID=1216297 RepID=A0ABS4IIK3_9BACI|nr:N-acetylmuramoyl-L-alanine amidase [Virgibacillus natechei]MBP1970789.1 N-acetylmuramoyl-L-alanine amidase [Virgibacillus natechei]UZD12310.1 N-acetylmuramoyl-L-alanine amidase [Virgibacillus natechei]